MTEDQLSFEGVNTARIDVKLSGTVSFERELMVDHRLGATKFFIVEAVCSGVGHGFDADDLLHRSEGFKVRSLEGLGDGEGADLLVELRRRAREASGLPDELGFDELTGELEDDRRVSELADSPS